MTGGAARAYTRRQAVALAAGAAASVLGMPACTQSTQPAAGATGFAYDTDARDYPVTLRLYVDSNIRWIDLVARAVDEEYGYHPTVFEMLMERYRKEPGRGDVTFDIAYAEPPELREMARDGFPDGDGVVALAQTIDIASECGTIDDGEYGYMIRKVDVQLPDKVQIVRMRGSDAALPPPPTLDGEDAVDGSYNHIQQIPNYDGLIALPDPERTTEGMMALKVLEHEGLYAGSLYGGGEYADGVAERFRLYPDQDTAMQALAGGYCQLGFALNSCCNERFTDIALAHDTQKWGSLHYYAAAIEGAPEPGVARDFFEFILHNYDI